MLLYGEPPSVVQIACSLGLRNQRTYVRDLRVCGVDQIACGLDSCYAVLEGGEVVSWGDNTLGQLGRPTLYESPGSAREQLASRLVRTREGSNLMAERVAAGLGHCLAVGLDGEVYSWGWNGAGQVGYPLLPSGVPLSSLFFPPGAGTELDRLLPPGVPVPPFFFRPGA